MSAGRKAHDADIGGIDVPCCGTISHKTHGSFGIGQRNDMIGARHAVFKHKEGNAAWVEEGRPLMTFVVDGQTFVGSARTTDNCASRRLLGQVAKKLCALVAERNLYFAYGVLCLRRRSGQQAKQKCKKLLLDEADVGCLIHCLMIILLFDKV